MTADNSGGAEVQYPPDTDLSNYSKVWTTLITSKSYLPGLLTLNYSLIHKNKSKYPLVALYTTQLDIESVKTIVKSNIPILRIQSLKPSNLNNLELEPRFYDTWSKLEPFKLTQFKRIIQIDSDMVVLQNMDELMEFPMNLNTVFAATAACVCNPLKFNHYPKDWVPENCSFTNYRSKIEQSKQSVNNHITDNTDSLQDLTRYHHIAGPCANLGLKLCNGGLIVLQPSMNSYNLILETLQDPEKTKNYDFPDQALLADVFQNNWLSLSYKYNSLKTLTSCHSDVWNIDEVKNIHYIITPKPWEVAREEWEDETNTFKYWWDANDERLNWEIKANRSLA